MVFFIEDMRFDATANEVARLRNELRQIKDELLDRKDRVDISLKEYEELKRVNKDLLDRLNHAESILGMIGIPADTIPLIDPDSVKVYSAESFDSGPFIRKQRYRIEFDTEE